jgi:hypothetical protein
MVPSLQNPGGRGERKGQAFAFFVRQWRLGSEHSLPSVEGTYAGSLSMVPSGQYGGGMAGAPASHEAEVHVVDPSDSITPASGSQPSDCPAATHSCAALHFDGAADPAGVHSPPQAVAAQTLLSSSALPPTETASPVQA